MHITQIINKKGFVPFLIPVEFPKFDIIGYFPYHTCRVQGNVFLPRDIFSYIEDELRNKTGISDNKCVLVCKDKEDFNTDDFAIFLKDCFAMVGKMEHIQDY